MDIIRAPDPIHLIPQIRPQPHGCGRMPTLQCRESIAFTDDSREVCRELFKIELFLISKFDHASMRGGMSEEGVGGVEEGFGCTAVLLHQ